MRVLLVVVVLVSSALGASRAAGRASRGLLHNLEKRLDLLRMARIFESPKEKQARADLLKLRRLWPLAG